MTELAVSPVFSRGGNVQVQTAAAGATFVAFGARTISQLTIVNDTGTAIEWQQDGDGVALSIADGWMFSIFGINDASQVSVRRKDQSAAQVSVKARWEA